MLAAYDSPERKFIRPGHKDAQAMWTSIYTNYTVLGYNSRLVGRDNLPKTHADLLKPIWRGQIGIVQTAYEWFAVMLQGMGQEKGLAFMRELAKQQPQLRNGRTLLAQLVAAGEVNSGLAAYSQNFENLKRDGAPVDWVALDPVYGNLNPMSLSAKAPHANAGKAVHRFCFVESRARNHSRTTTCARSDRRFARSAETGSRIFRGFHRRSGLREL